MPATAPINLISRPLTTASSNYVVYEQPSASARASTNGTGKSLAFILLGSLGSLGETCFGLYRAPKSFIALIYLAKSLVELAASAVLGTDIALKKLAPSVEVNSTKIISYIQGLTGALIAGALGYKFLNKGGGDKFLRRLETPLGRSIERRANKFFGALGLKEDGPGRALAESIPLVLCAGLAGFGKSAAAQNIADPDFKQALESSALIDKLCTGEGILQMTPEQLPLGKALGFMGKMLPRALRQMPLGNLVSPAYSVFSSWQLLSEAGRGLQSA